MRPLITFLFFLSGACGLVYEIVWARVSVHIFGSTAVAVGTILGAFMSGLAFGSWLLGGVADRSQNPLRLYALLEVGVGLASLLSFHLLLRITPVYLGAYELFGRSESMLVFARFALAFLLVMAPTVLMGATLPALARHFLSNLTTAGRGLSTLYAVNTAGAVTGVILAGFLLIRLFGLERTVQLAALANVTIGVVAYLASRSLTVADPDSSPAVAPGPPPESGLAPPQRRVLLLVLLISGVCSFAYEIYWTRSLVFILGNSTYAVSTMLTAFLGGIALGGYLVRFLVDRFEDRAILFGGIQVAIGIASAMALPVLFAVGDPQALRGFLGGAVDRVGLLMLMRFGVALLVMMVPAAIIGMTFPLIGRIGLVRTDTAGATVGRIYAVNTVGNVLGAILPGLILLRLLGIQRGILLMSALNVAAGLLILSLRTFRQGRRLWLAPAALAASALFLAFTPLGFRFPAEVQESWHRVLYYREGPSATTSVLLGVDTREKSMCVDGVHIGGTGFTDYKQQLLAHLPKLLVDDCRNELSIGLGSGILVGESARHADVKRITCVEIEPSVVQGAAFFARENRGALTESRIRIVVDDVANFLRTTRDSFQVISADEKTGQEYASNGFSYSREYYTLLRERLAPGGIVAQWVPTTLPPRQYSLVLATFARTFPHMQLWYFPPAFQVGTFNTILIGSNEPIPLSLDLMREKFESRRGEFAGIEPYGLTSPEAVLVHYVANGEEVLRRVADSPVNSLDRPFYEFYSPSEYAVPPMRRLAANLDLLETLLRDAKLPEIFRTGSLARALAADRVYREADRADFSGSALDFMRRFDPILELAPDNENLRARISLQYVEFAPAYLNDGEFEAAAALLDRAIAVWDRRTLTHVDFAIALDGCGQTEHAIEELRLAVAREPDLLAARRALAAILLSAGRRKEAEAELRAILEVEPGDEQALRYLRRP